MEESPKRNNKDAYVYTHTHTSQIFEKKKQTIAYIRPKNVNILAVSGKADFFPVFDLFVLYV